MPRNGALIPAGSRSRVCLEGAVIDVGPIQSSRCPDSRIAQARLLVLPTLVAEAGAYAERGPRPLAWCY
jgi:hypothetical protein